ncbi:MAG: D-lyxose/D-mannose family sugar isomerase [Bacteroidales bacterium]|nr:D-lyxose/D-mannose family sugar isomerase [Bacteroidales bacterium]
MRRSEINAILRDAEKFLKSRQFYLPEWATWDLHDWRSNKDKVGYIVERMLGWDITDFGSGDFLKRGLFLFTMRNGKYGADKKPYAEKIMIVEENQETPFHFHWSKMEDIINRGGGNLVIEVYNADEHEQFADSPVRIRVDGIEHIVEPGGKIILHPGQSVCQEQFLYHRFYGEPGHGKVMVGEVSQCNDDNIDNRFYEAVGRFPDIDEDEEPLYLLCSDYKKFL